MAAVVEPERQHRVARLQQPEIDRHVRLRAGMGLDVRVLCLEERLGPVDRQLLDLVDDLAAAVVPLARVSLRVLVRRHRADGLEDRRPGEVLRRDQLDLPALPRELVAEERRDVRIDLGKARGAQFGEGMSGGNHASTMLLQGASPLRRGDPLERLSLARVGRRRHAAAGSPAPARDHRLTSVTSITVTLPAARPRRAQRPPRPTIADGTSASVRGSGSPGRFALVATTAPRRPTISAVGPVSTGTRSSDRLGPPSGQPGEPAAPGSAGSACTAREEARGRSRASRSSELGEMSSRRLVDAREQHRRRLDRIPPLEPVEVGGGLSFEGGADEAVHRVRRQHCELPVRISATISSTSLKDVGPRRPDRCRRDRA